MRAVCYACAAEVGARERIGRRDTCPRCGVDLHSCRQCRFYDTRAYNACGEPQAERVLDKERGNFCDYFAPSAGAAAVGAATAGAPSETAAPPRAIPERDAHAELDRLFRRR